MRFQVWYAAAAIWLAGLLVGWSQGDPFDVKVSRIDIKYVGPASVSENFIRAQIRLQPGSLYRPASIDEDIQNLYTTGLFYNIRVTEEVTPDGIALAYIVQTKPRLTEIRFEGNERIKTKKLKKKVKSEVGQPLDERKLFTDAREIQKFYEKKGYPSTTVKYTRYIDEAAGRGIATFEITESPKVKIREVQFIGAKAFPQKKLRKVIKTRKRWWMSWLTGSGIFKEDQFEEDKVRLEAFYREKGYLDFHIEDVQFDNPEPDRLVIRFQVYEGRLYSVDSIAVEGPELFPPEQIEGLLQLRPGMTFTPGALQEDVERIEDFYGRQGYIDVKAGTPNLVVARIPNIEAGTIALKYTINEGQKSFIEKIEIRGNTKTRDKVIRRELSVSPGEVFDTVGTKLSRTRIEGLQYFSKVDLRPESTTIPNRKNLVISVEEKNTGNMSLGAGFSSVDALVGFVEFTQSNFDIARPPNFQGGGQKMRLRLQLGTRRQDYTLQFIEPWFLGRKLEFTGDLFFRELGFVSLQGLYDESRAGGRMGWRRPLWSDFFIGGIGYSLQEVGIINVEEDAPPDIKSEEGYSLLSTMFASLSYDTRRGVGLPSGGQKTELIGTLTGGPLGGEKDFYKLELKTSWYFPGFAKGHVLEVVGRTGVADEISNTPTVPFYDRYYLGGLYSLRGYEFRAVGPSQQVGTTNEYEPVGGNTYWFATAEYSIPIIERLRVAAFYDIGMVYPDSFSFSPQPQLGLGYDTGQYADNWGIGLRINLPIGPLRLDYAIPITHSDLLGSSGRFQFGVGYTRDF